MLEDLKGKKVRVSMSAWEINSYKPCLYEAVLVEVSGTMCLLKEMVTWSTKDKVPDTWVNSSSFLFNFVQEIGKNI